jgi:hypothetical protein
VALNGSARSKERCFRLDELPVSPLKDVAAAIDGLLLTPHYVRYGFTQHSRTLIERQLTVGKSLTLVVSRF